MTRMRNAPSSANACLTLAVLMELKVGKISTKDKWRKISVRDAGATTARKPSNITAKKTSRDQLISYAQIRGSNRFPRLDTDRMIFWSEYSGKAVALIQAKGIPIDLYLWDIIQENRHAIINDLLRRFDPSH